MIVCVLAYDCILSVMLILLSQKL